IGRYRLTVRANGNCRTAAWGARRSRRRPAVGAAATVGAASAITRLLQARTMNAGSCIQLPQACQFIEISGDGGSIGKSWLMMSAPRYGANALADTTMPI